MVVDKAIANQKQKAGDSNEDTLPDLLNLSALSCNSRPFLIGVCGGTASGKTTVCQKIIATLENEENPHDNCPEERRAVLVHQDSFYKPLNTLEVDASDYNFDHPDAFDFDLINQVLLDLSAGKAVDIPIYDFKTHQRAKETQRILPARVILFEGILCFDSKELRDMFHMKIFVDCDCDTRLARRVLRDMEHRGRDLDSVLGQYIDFVKPAFDDFILPSKKYADVIIPRGADNVVAIDLIGQHIKDQFKTPIVPPIGKRAATRSRSASPLVVTPTFARPH